VIAADVAEVGGVTAAAAATGLPGASRVPPQAPLPDDEWDQLLADLIAERLTGLLYAAVADGGWPATDTQRESLLDLHLKVLGSSLLLERTLLHVVEALAAESIEVRVLKGVAVAQLDYAHPAQRAFGDMDLLVRADDAERVGDVLSNLGGRRDQPAARPGFDRRFGKSFTYLLPGAFEVDVHRTFVMGPYGLTIDLDDLWHRGQTFRLGGRDLVAVSPEVRLLHAAYSAVLSNWPPRLRPRRDVAQMVLNGSYHADRVIAMAKSWRAEAVLATAINETWQAFDLADVTALTAWAEHYHLTDQDRRLLSLYRRPDPPYSQLALHSLSALPGLPEKVAFVSALSLPKKEFLQRRGTSLPKYLLRGTRRALRRRPA
jgi:hypothetical protein